MARIRTIKPDFWTHEKVLGLSPLARLMFIGMWNFADDYGRMDYAPRSIKARIFPADDVVTVESVKSMLGELSSHGLIIVYSAKDREYLEITGWDHQRIDKRQPSKIPGPFEDGSTKFQERSSNSADHSPTPAPVMEGKGEDRKEGSRRVAGATPPLANSKFDEFWKEYPKRDGDNPRKTAEKKFAALVKTGVDPEVIIAGAKRASMEARKRNDYGTRFIPQAIKWLNDQRFLDIAVETFAGADDGMVEVLDQLQLEAWDAYGLQHRGRKYPRDRKGGWRFPSKWPPGYEPNLTDDVNDMSIQ
jgi:hypothetical protein